MLHLVAAYSDLVGGVLGILGSVALGIPFISEAADRREWELLVRFRGEVLKQDHTSLTAEELEAHRQIRERIIDYRLGQYEKFRLITILGFMLLLAAFAFMAIASIGRISQIG